jgi:cytochrome P450
MHAAAAGMLDGLRDGARVNLQAVLEAAAIDSLGRAMFSVPLSRRADRIVALVKQYFGSLGQPQIWDLLARRESDFGWSLLGRRNWSRRWFAEIEAIIQARRAMPAAGGGAQDVLDLLFEARDHAGEPLSDDAIRDEVASTMAAGFETTSRLLTWAVYLLSRDRSEQDLVRAEIERAPPNAVTDLAGLKGWPRLNAVLFEALRLYPPVPFLLRMARSHDHAMGVDIRPRDVVIVSPWLMHRHHNWWAQPDTFLPERFVEAPERGRGGAFIPFGLGRRVCVGGAFAMAEASLILASLLERFDVELDDPRPVMPTGFVTSPNRELWYRLRRLH